MRELEAQVVRAHQQVGQEQAEAQRFPRPADEPDYAAAIRALCVPGAVSPIKEKGSVWMARTEDAEAQEEALQQEHGLPEARYGCEILWHPLFPAEYVACVGKLPLYEVAEFHEALPGWCNLRRPLDEHDYAYLADVLREALASQPGELAALRLARALAWVEQATFSQLAPASTATPVGQATTPAASYSMRQAA